MKTQTSHMKAAVYREYGAPEVVKIEEIKTPAPASNEIRVKVHAAAVNTGDVRIRKADPFLVRLFFGLFKPNTPVLGVDFSGIVESIGEGVTRFKVGDEVFGSVTNHGLGAHAEYLVIPEDGTVTRKPANVSFTDVAGVFFGANTSLHFLREGNVGPGQKVLVYGASGGVGVYAIQIAKHMGAHVTAIASKRNLEFVKSLGADEVIDYSKEDFSTRGTKWDVIFDTIGKSPFRKSVKALNDSGHYLRTIHMTPGAIFKGIATGLTSKKKVIGGVAIETLENLDHIAGLMEEGSIRPVVERTFDFNDIVDAHRFVDTGKKRGSVVVTVVSEP